jgi:hypothetical protein
MVMMTFPKAVPLDIRSTEKPRSSERLSIGTSLLIWLVLVGVSWLGITGLFGLIA